MAAILLRWLSIGHLALLGLSELFPRYVFAVGPGSGWWVAACVAAVCLVLPRMSFDAVRADLATVFAAPWRRRVALLIAAGILGASALMCRNFPAGVHAELVHADGTRSAVGRRADLDLDRQELLALAGRVRHELESLRSHPVRQSGHPCSRYARTARRSRPGK